MNPRADRFAGLILLLFAVAPLVVALVAEKALGMAPCPLCLLERWPYRIAALLGLIALLLPGRWPRPLLWLGLLAFLVAVGLGFLHFGVERHWWPSPLPECNAPNLSFSNLANLANSLPARPSKPCDAPNFLIPGLPISFVTMGFLYSCFASALLASYLTSARKENGQ